jgi:hypothetical protein
MPDILHLVFYAFYTAVILVIGLYIGRNNPKLLGELPGSASGALNDLKVALSSVASDVKAIKITVKA